MKLRRACLRCRLELLGVDVDAYAKQLASTIVETYIGSGLIGEAVDRALLASARTGTRPSRRSIHEVALAWLALRLDREIDRRLCELDERSRRLERDVDHLDAQVIPRPVPLD